MEDYSEIDLKGTVYEVVDWIHAAENIFQLWTLVNANDNERLVLKNTGNLMTIRATICS
jgi:hypothetical protein